MENTIRYKLLSKMPTWYVKKHFLWFNTSAGTFSRLILLIFAAILFGETFPLLGIVLFLCVVWIVYSRVFRVLWGFYRFMYGPTPQELYRGYKKLWGVAKNGPIQKTIKVPSSQNTP